MTDVDFESDDDEDEDFEDFTANEGEEDAHITDENELKISTKSNFSKYRQSKLKSNSNKANFFVSDNLYLCRVALVVFTYK